MPSFPDFKKNPILSGAIILTLAGFLSRFIGFFYRIFLSQQIGAEGMGVYQLIFPVFGICFSLCCGPVQTAVSRYVAAQNAVSLHGHDRGRSNQSAAYSPEAVLRAGLLLSFSLACLCAVILYTGSELIADRILLEARCGQLLRLMSLTVPICSLHCCISGYYYGLQRASVPAFAQLAEQAARVLSVFLISSVMTSEGQEPTTAVAVWGMVFGELASLLFSGTAFFMRKNRPVKNPAAQTGNTAASSSSFASASAISYLPKIFSLALPLAATRLCISILQSAEAILIPSRLRLHGMTDSQALSVYGVLTGMAYPFILFPTAVINSVAVMLLPDMARSQSIGNQERIDITTTRTVTCSIYLGILCTGLFLFYGDSMGERLYASTLAGSYITTLSWLCPFLYLSTTLGSILNGLGKTRITFFHNVVSLLSQLLFVLFLVPAIGIRGYLYGLLFGQLMMTVLHLISVRRFVRIRYHALHHLLRPMGALGLAAFASKKITEAVLTSMISQPVIQLGISCSLLALLYGLLLLFSRKKP